MVAVSAGQALRHVSADARRVEGRLGAMFADCLQAFHAFAELAELAENLRILSLNAELAAGRAGEKGRAVRALTQYTRELVNRLSQIQADTSGLMDGAYTQTAAALRLLHQLRLLDRALLELARFGADGGDADKRISASRAQMAQGLSNSVRSIITGIRRLEMRAQAVAEVVSASDSIATNIAIEAAAAGVHEAEFRTVADTMRRYVEQLRAMVDVASGGVRSAIEKASAISMDGASRAVREGSTA